MAMQAANSNTAATIRTVWKYSFFCSSVDMLVLGSFVLVGDGAADGRGGGSDVMGIFAMGSGIDIDSDSDIDVMDSDIGIDSDIDSVNC
mmetsp:Transcript_21945/g.47652  ORF Transcript_21945/g.47652 Transcript_21945/m.47652 type:complete len:89 (+) Transcript_21945:391-657(+)